MPFKKYREITCPQSKWISEAKELGFFLPADIKDKGRCGTTGKESGTDASYKFVNENGVAKLRLHNFRASGDNQNVVLVDDSQAPTKQDTKMTKRDTKPTTDTSPDTDSDEQTQKAEIITKMQTKYYSCSSDAQGNAYLQKKGVPCVPGLRKDGQVLIVPFRDGKGNLMGLQYIKPDGSKSFETGSELGGACFTIQGLPDTGRQYVLVCEGLATGISLWYSTYATVVVAGSASQMCAGVRYAKENYPGRPIICCADNDNVGDSNTGLDAAMETSRTYGCYLAKPTANKGEKVDFNDLHLKFGRDKVLEVVEAAMDKGYVRIPERFRLDNEGLHVEVQKGKLFSTELISQSPLEVLEWAKPFNADNSWQLHVHWKNLDGEWEDTYLQTDVAASDPKYISGLLGKSFITNWNKYRNDIYEYLIGTKTNRRIWLANHCGWEGDLYLTPTSCFGCSPVKVRAGVPVDEGEFAPKGELDDFKKLTTLAQGNDTFVMALCTACAAPLLGLADLESGGFHLVGPSSCGKSTALKLATAFWRNPERITAWAATRNALEYAASKYHDSLMAIDEISQASAYDLEQCLYMLGNGIGKKRCKATKSGVQEAEQLRWKILILSTGEESPDLKLQKEGRDVMAGQTVRFVTIPVEADHIHNLHGYESSKALVDDVKAQFHRSYGVAGERYLQFLTAYAAPLRKELPNVIEKYEAELCQCLSDGNDGEQIDNQIGRVATRFAVCIVGGCLASAWGVIDISEDEIIQSVTRLFKSWIEYRGGIKAAETMAVVKGTRKALNTHADRFLPDEDVCDVVRMKTVLQPRNGIAGYIVTKAGAEGYYLTSDFFTELCEELRKARTTVRDILLQEGILIPGGEKDRVVTRYKPPYHLGKPTDNKESRQRFYRIFYPDMFLAPKTAEPETDIPPISDDEFEKSIQKTLEELSSCDYEDASFDI